MDVFRTLLMILILGVLLLQNPIVMVEAQGETPTDDDINRVARDLYCPVCENIPLDTCGTKACEQWRGVIKDKLAEGWTDQQIKDYFVDQYGDRVLAEPPPRGFNWLVYLVPPVAFAAGLILVFMGYQRWNKADSEAAIIPDVLDQEAGIEPPDEYLDMVEEELQKRRDE